MTTLRLNSQRLLLLVSAAVALIVFTFLLSAICFAEGRRVALVVGNGAYQSVPQLPNPKNDAEAVSTALRKQGFEVVTAIDLSRVELEKAVERYARALNGADISLFYYSGHGIEVSGENRIIPVDATLNEPQDLETQTFSLQTILLYMQSNSQAQLIYLDACRDNPFNDRAFLLGTDEAEKPAGKGLAEQKGAIGSLIAYATEPGKVALDGSGANSPFTSAVIKHSFSQNIDVQTALMEVTAEVWEATQKNQRPWINSTLVKPVFLNDVLAKSLATNVPVITKTLAEIQLNANTQQVLAGPVTLGAGEQSVFDEETAHTLPEAKAYKLMQMPLSGTLSVEGQILSEGAVVDFDKFKALKFEPSTDVQVFREANSSAILVPAVVVETAAISSDGAALPVQLKIKQRMHECDLLAAEPLDLQAVSKGAELDEIDVTEALAACQKAVAEHPLIVRYIYQLGRAHLRLGHKDEARKLIQQAADKGHVRAFNQLGLLAETLEEANVFFKLAAEKGDPAGLLSYGRNLVKGQGVKANVKLGFEMLKRAAELGNSDALDEMGTLYLYGGALKASPKRAAGFLEASVSRSVKKASRNNAGVFAGHFNAATDLGQLYFSGNGLRKDMRKAIKWYEMGAELGNQGGVANLSQIFAEGLDGLRNPNKAVWYTSLALATEGLVNDPALLQRLALLPDGAKRQTMRDLVNMVGPCATETTEGIDDTLLLLSRKAWLQRQSQNGEMQLPSSDGSFSPPDGTGTADELRYWNLIKQADTDQAYLAYLEHFPDGVFAEIARGRLGGLFQRVKSVTSIQTCEPPAPPKAKSPARKVEPLKLKPAPPKIIKQKPKPPPAQEQPKKKPPVRVKPPRPPRVIIEEDIPVIEEDPGPKFEIPFKRRFPRFLRLPVPLGDDKCGPDGC